MKKNILFFSLITLLLLQGCGRISPVQLKKDSEYHDFQYPPRQEDETPPSLQPLTAPQNPDAQWRDEPLQYL